MRFQSAANARKCIELLDHRYFDERELLCYYWDGKTDYKKEKESDQDL